MIEMQTKVDHMENAQQIRVDGRAAMPEESATVATPRGVAVQIQGLLGKLNSLLHVYQGKAGTPSMPSHKSPAIQVTDLPGI